MLRRWFSPKSILLHIAVLVAAGGCAWLCDWQYHRAIGGNGLSWAYVFEWPFFGCCAIYLWWDMIHHPEKRAPVMWATSRRVSAAAGTLDAPTAPEQRVSAPLSGGANGVLPAPAGPPAARPGAIGAIDLGTIDLGADHRRVADPGTADPCTAPRGVVDAAVVADFPTEEQDPALAAYNRYLAELHASDRRRRR